MASIFQSHYWAFDKRNCSILRFSCRKAPCHQMVHRTEKVNFGLPFLSEMALLILWNSIRDRSLLFSSVHRTYTPLGAVASIALEDHSQCAHCTPHQAAGRKPLVLKEHLQIKNAWYMEESLDLLLFTGPNCISFACCTRLQCTHFVVLRGQASYVFLCMEFLPRAH